MRANPTSTQTAGRLTTVISICGPDWCKMLTVGCSNSAPVGCCAECMQLRQQCADQPSSSSSSSPSTVTAAASAAAAEDCRPPTTLTGVDTIDQLIGRVPITNTAQGLINVTCCHRWSITTLQCVSSAIYMTNNGTIGPPYGRVSSCNTQTVYTCTRRPHTHVDTFIAGD